MSHTDGGSPGGVLATIGSTPLVELTELDPGVLFGSFAKLEAHNPGGSIKDRSALGMLLGRIRDGRLVPGRSVVVESSSGNLGIGLAQVCGYHGIRFICVVDPRTNEQNIAIMRAFGAEVEIVTDVDPVTGEYLPMRVRRVRELVARLPHAYCPDQYANPLNPLAHRTTMREIVDALPGGLDFLFCATSSCGTLRGCAEYVRARRLPVTIVAVDAAGSAIFGPPTAPQADPRATARRSGPALSPRRARGPGRARRRPRLRGGLPQARRPARRSSPAGRPARWSPRWTSMRDRIPAGATCALVFPDRGERYLDTIYDDDWVTTHFGDVSHLWKEAEPMMGVAAC